MVIPSVLEAERILGNNVNVQKMYHGNKMNAVIHSKFDCL